MPIIHPSLVGAEVASEVGEVEAAVGGGRVQGKEEGRLHDGGQRGGGCGGRGSRGRGRSLVDRPDGHPRGEEGQEGIVRVDVAKVRVQRVERDEVIFRLGHCLGVP